MLPNTISGNAEILPRRVSTATFSPTVRYGVMFAASRTVVSPSRFKS